MTDNSGLNAVLDAVTDGILTLDLNARVLASNAAAARLLLTSVGQLIGKRFDEFLPAGRRDAFAQMLADGECVIGAATMPFDSEIDLQRTDGARIRARFACRRYTECTDVRFDIILVDRSAMLRTHQELDASDLVNRLLIDHSVVGITLTDANRRWLRVNKAYCDMLGYGEEELQQLDFAQITHPQDRARDLAALAELNAGKIPNFSHEKRYIRKDGSICWARVHVAGVFDNGRLTHYATQVVDISAHKQVQARNEALHMELQAFVDHVPASIALKDRDGRFTLVSRQLAAALHLGQRAFIGKTASEIGIPGYPVNNADSDEARILGSGAILESEAAASWAPEQILRTYRFPIRSVDGAIRGTGMFATDITALKRHEQQLIAQAATIGMLQRIATAANQADGAEAAMQSCLQLICEHHAWTFGEVFCRSASDGLIEQTGLIFAARAGLRDAFEAYRRHREGGPDHALIERVRLSRAAACDPIREGSALARKFSVTHELAFPIVVDGDLHAVFKCYSDRPIALDDELRELLSFASSQIVHAVVREAAQRQTARALGRLDYHIDNSSIGVLQTDAEFRIATWSSACERIFGWTSAEVIGKTCDEIGFVHPDDEPLLDELVAAFADPRVTSYHLMNRNLTKSGKTVHIDWFNSMLRHDDGELETNLAVLVDRTAEVEALRALEEERQLFVAGPTMVFRWRDEPGWPIEYASPNVETILGYRPADLINGPAQNWRSLHADDLTGLYRELDEFRASDKTHWSYAPYRMRTADGKTIWVKTFARRLDNPGGSDRYVAYAMDISETVELQNEMWRQQERLVNVVEGTDAGTFEWDVRTNRTNFDERWASMLGYSLDELRPMEISTWEKLVHPQDLPAARGLLRDHLSARSTHFDIEYRLRHRDGSWVWVQNRGKIVERLPDGTALRIAGTHIDISNRKRAEEAVRESNEALKASNVELERFAYIASHDLQEPLRMVASFTQLLNKKYAHQLDSTAAQYIHFACDGAVRMQQLISDLLSYSRLGRQQIEDQVIDMDALVARVLQSMQLSIKDASAEIVRHALPVVRGDKGQLTRLLQNLLTNAIKYRSSEPLRIEIGSEEMDDGLVFRIRDNGIGIEPHDAERVFEVFQRLHSRSKYPGTGIGLSVCKLVVERHGGRIWFESVPGEGTSFLFTLAKERYGRGEGPDPMAEAEVISVT